MKKNVMSVFAIMMLSGALWAAEADTEKKTTGANSTIIMVSGGKSDYSIVVPDGEDSRGRVRKAANYLQSTLKEATTVLLPIVRESQHPAAKPAIYLGKTKAAIKAKLPVSDLTGWTYLKTVRENDLFLVGHDGPAVVRTRPGDEFLGTLKAVLSFLQDEAGVRFLLPGPNGVHIPKMDTLAVSSNLMVLRRPVFANGTSSKTEPIYDVANNYTKAYLYKSYGGHSYYDAVPKAKYGETHPEYFAMFGGKRSAQFNHLCISNPQVQELMLKEMGKYFDLGYDLVQLAQTDGYRACECDKCLALAGKDAGEALWIVHRKLAEEVKKRWPGRKVMLLVYGPTGKTPKTFDKFPDNVVLELCDYSDSDFARWNKFGDTFFTYVYNWGTYHVLGFLPKRTPTFAALQLRRFDKNNVAGIYKCGFGENLGLEGPVYYVYGQMMADTTQDPDVLANDFYRAAYGKARTPMKAFFNDLYKRLELYSNVPGSKDPKRLGGPIIPQVPEEMITTLFPTSLIIAMEDNLQQAFQMDDDARVQARLRLVEREFLYLKNIVAIFTYYRTYRMSGSWAAFDLMETELNRRTELIDGWFIERRGANYNPKAEKQWQMRVEDGWPWFLGNPTRDFLRQGGRLSGKLAVPPFSWNMKLLRETKKKFGDDVFKKKSLKVARLSTDVKPGEMPDEKVWQKITSEELGEIGCGALREATAFRIAYDMTAIYFSFVCNQSDIEQLANFKPYGRDGSCASGECLEIFIDPFGTREKYYHFIFNPVPESYYDANYGFITDQIDPRFGKPDTAWDGVWDYATQVDKKNKRWTAQVRIPFATLGVPAPKSGEKWTMNVCREHIYTGGAEQRNRELSTWSPNLEERSFHAINKFGTITFE